MKLTIASGLTLALLCVGTAYGGDKIPIKGTYTGVDSSSVNEISKEHMVVVVRNEGLGYLLEAPNNNNPMQYAAGPCAGWAEVKSGVGSGKGSCLRTNPQGGKWHLTWEVLSDTSKGIVGKWEIKGIAGNTLGWKGSGTWGPRTDTSAGHYIMPFVGSLEAP